VPLSEAKVRLSELTKRVRQQHERITLTRNGEAEAVLLSVDDLEGMEMTLQILGDVDAVARISAGGARAPDQDFAAPVVRASAKNARHRGCVVPLGQVDGYPLAEMLVSARTAPVW
jgi:prevent-host-death family protein